MTNAPATPSQTTRPEPPSEPLLTSHEAADACEVEERWIGVFVARGDLRAQTRFPLAFLRSDLVIFLRAQGHAGWADEVAKGLRPVCRASRPS